MKNRMILTMSVLVVALSLTAAANAQERSGSTSGIIQKTKVDLPCTATQTSEFNVHLVATNSTPTWLPQGTTIYFKGEGVKKVPFGAFGTIAGPYPLPGGKTVLGIAVRSGAQFTLINQSTGLYAPFTCSAWYFK